MRTIQALAGAALAALTLGMAAPAAAQAQSYDLFGDFGSPAFAYGSGTNGSSFIEFTNLESNCSGSAGTSCYDNADGGFPFVGKNGSGTPTTYFPVDALSFQAAAGASTGLDALIRFTAPDAGTYTISGFTASEDPTGGRGQVVSIFDSVAGVSSNLYSTNVTGGYQAENPFGALTAVLGAGDTITFGVANVNGDNRNMTTGIEADIQFSPLVAAGVPEPASWAMLIAGFSLIGYALRHRSRTTVRYV